jgi:hypothetical protein
MAELRVRSPGQSMALLVRTDDLDERGPLQFANAASLVNRLGFRCGRGCGLR